MANPISEKGRVEVKERTTLQKFEGDPDTGELVETVEIEDGKIISVKKEE